LYVIWLVVCYVGCCIVCELLYKMWNFVSYVGCVLVCRLFYSILAVLWSLCTCIIWGLLHCMWRLV